MELKALLFDMDGTLVDNMHCHDQAWVKLFADEGVQIDLSTFFSKTAGMKNPPILRMFLGEDLSDEECERLAVKKESIYRDLYADERAPHAGLPFLLDACDQAGILLGVATSAPTVNIDFILDGLDLRRRFQAVTGAADIERGKPEPDIYLKSAEKLGVLPQECLVFEDAPMGVESARRAGMPCICLSTSLSDDECRAIPGVHAVSFDFTPWSLDSLRSLHQGAVK
jgi:beta-phosphoglucomutase